MKKKLRLAAWVLACAAVIFCLNPIFVPKWTTDLATTYTINGFYEEEKDSLDVVFFGSSQVLCGVSPMEIYEKSKIKSYDLGTGSQSILCTYHWLKEMVKYQKPKVVVLDTWMAVDESILDDETNRHALDYMRLSWNKVQAAAAVERTYNKKYGFKSTTASFLVPLLRFHSRWKELEPYDVSYWFSDKHFARKGYCPGEVLFDTQRENYRGVKPDPDAEEKEISDYQREYLQKIIAFCKEEEIALLFIKTPLAYYDASLHNTIETIAEESGMPFLDFNMRNYWKAAEIDDTTDFQSPAHLNISGADKVSAYLADYLIEHYPKVKEAAERAKRQDKNSEGNTALWEEQLKEYRSYEEPYRNALFKEIAAKSRSASSP